MTILLVDNRDSFTYNVADALARLGRRVTVLAGAASTVEQCLELCPTHIVIGPGPGAPADVPLSMALLDAAAAHGIATLGVCLGMQCLAVWGGAAVGRAAAGPRHGKLSTLQHDGEGLFAGLPQDFAVCRYHSLAVDAATVSEPLAVSASADDGTVMALRHRSLPLCGVQFHPESVASSFGMEIFNNWLQGRGCATS